MRAEKRCESSWINDVQLAVGSLKYHRHVRLLIRVFTRGREIVRKFSAYFLDADDATAREIAFTIMVFDLATDGAPAFITDMTMNTPVSDNFYFPVGEQQVDEHTVIFLSVPNPHE